MESLKLDSRNLLGAGFGGILGILAFAYIHPFAMLVGCLVGAALGYHHDPVWSAMTGMYTRLNARFSRIDRTQFEGWKLLRAFIAPSQHSRIMMTRWAASLSFIAIMVSVFGTLIWASEMLLPELFAVLTAIALVVLGFFTTLVTLLVVGMNRWDETDVVDNWEKLCFTNRRYFAVVVKDMMMFSLAVAYALSVLGLWYATVGLFFHIVILGSIAFTLGLMQGTYIAVSKGKYGLAFVVSLAVGIVSVSAFGEYFDDHRQVWATALATGLMSALLAECCRLLLLQFFTKHPVGVANTTTTLKIVTKPALTFFDDLTANMGTFLVAERKWAANLVPYSVKRGMM